jgi:hypothetical protein
VDGDVWNFADRENLKYLERIVSNCHFTHHETIWSGLVKKPGFRGDRLATEAVARLLEFVQTPVGQDWVHVVLTGGYPTELRRTTFTSRFLTHLPLTLFVAFHLIRAYEILYLKQRCEIQ